LSYFCGLNDRCQVVLILSEVHKADNPKIAI
jgi:hypothetical protein